MLFKELLDEKYRELRPSFEDLYQLVVSKQTHQSDLLLVYLNASYHPEVYNWDNIKPTPSPYSYGPNKEGHSEKTHFDFIGEYIDTHMAAETFNDYLKSVTYDTQKRDEIERLIFKESISVQTEMLIYLKIWESDMFIKKWYQLANLTEGNDYNWHFLLSTSSRPVKADPLDRRPYFPPTGTRDVIIRKKIRDKFQYSLPAFYAAFKRSYNVQIRNSIAHSQYSILNRYIHLNNNIDGDPHNQIMVVSFDEWIDRFHETLVLYTLYRDFFNHVNENYGTAAMQFGGYTEIRINRKDPEVKTEYGILYYRPQFKSWAVNPD